MESFRSINLSLNEPCVRVNDTSPVSEAALVWGRVLSDRTCDQFANDNLYTKTQKIQLNKTHVMVVVYVFYFLQSYTITKIALIKFS